MLDAAQRLFGAHGYGATTLQQIADEADVAVQTVYATFGNKQQLLRDALDVAIAGDDAAVAVNERDWMHDVFHHRDPAVRLERYARAVRRIHERAADMFIALETAAAADPALRAMADEAAQQRRRGAASVVDALLDVTTLAEGLVRPHAVDVVWTLNSAEVYRLLVRQSGWTGDDYETWLGRTLNAQLLPANRVRRTRSSSR